MIPTERHYRRLNQIIEEAEAAAWVHSKAKGAIWRAAYEKARATHKIYDSVLIADKATWDTK